MSEYELIGYFCNTKCSIVGGKSTINSAYLNKNLTTSFNICWKYN